MGFGGVCCIVPQVGRSRDRRNSRAGGLLGRLGRRRSVGPLAIDHRSWSLDRGAAIGELDPGGGARLPAGPHTDSAEETIAVVAGTAEVVVEGRASRVSAGGLAVVPAGTVHEVRCADTGPLRFIAVYAGTDVVTRYEAEVQPDCSRERRPIA